MIAFKKEFDYKPNTKTTDDIIEMMNVNEEDIPIVKDMILHFEKTAAEAIRTDKCIRIPRIGQFKHSEYNEYKNKHIGEFVAMRKSMEKEEFKHAMKVKLLAVKQDIKKADNEKWAKHRQANND